MLRQITAPLRYLASRLGRFQLLLLVLAIIGVVGGLIWERRRHPPLPPGAAQVATTTATALRQTSYRIDGSADDVRAFYQQALPARGWSYCGTQATARCTNMPSIVEANAQVTDVYRREGDTEYSGPTVEIWPIPTDDGQTFVTVLELRGG